MAGKPIFRWITGLVCITMLAGCGSNGQQTQSGQTDTNQDISSSQGETLKNQPTVENTSADGSQTDGQAEPAQGQESPQKQQPPGPGGGEDASASENSPPPQAPIQPVQLPEPSGSYDFSQPVPESGAVDLSYFEDAAFVGDSRTDGFMLYSGIGCGEDLTSNGLSIFTLQTKKAIEIDGVSYTLLEALAKKEYGKVYLSLGVNELGYNNDQGFYQAYCSAIDAIRACQPNAVIYIQGLIPINEDVIAATGGASYLTNEHLLVYNDLMKQVAQEKRVAFLDLNPEFAGEDGQLPEDASGDGVHLRSAYCKQWLEYLRTHTVAYDQLYAVN